VNESSEDIRSEIAAFEVHQVLNHIAALYWEAGKEGVPIEEFHRGNMGWFNDRAVEVVDICWGLFMESVEHGWVEYMLESEAKKKTVEKKKKWWHW